MEDNKNKVSEFYDGYIDNQKRYSFNKRHYFLYNKLLSYGLNTNSTVLEMGCGIGVITSLISKKIKQGRIVACDISKKSIEISKKNNTSNNIEFLVSDIAKFKYKKCEFDYITFFDVLEHIPEEQHSGIFKNIANYMTEKTKLMINIPTAEAINYFKKNQPNILQVIDQPLSVQGLLTNLYSAALRLEYFELLSIWSDRDYQFLTLVKEKEYKNIQIPQKKQSLVKRIVKKIIK